MFSSLVHALQWADTAFPSGRYTLSNGLEALSQWQDPDFPEPHILIEHLMRYSFTPVDLVAHYCAWNAQEDQLPFINTMVNACRTLSSARLGSIRVGKQMAFMAKELNIPLPSLDNPHQPVITALIHKYNGLDADEAAIIELFSFVSQTASAALRLGMCDHIQAQKIIQHCSSFFEECIDHARTTPIEEMGSYTPLLEAACARHEHAPARLFIN